MRKDFAGVQKMVCIKGAFQTLLLFHVIFGELDRHQIAFFNTHPMFVGDVSDIKDDNILDAICIGLTGYAATNKCARVNEIAPFVKLMEDNSKICDYGKER